MFCGLNLDWNSCIGQGRGCVGALSLLFEPKAEYLVSLAKAMFQHDGRGSGRDSGGDHGVDTSANATKCLSGPSWMDT